MFSAVSTLRRLGGSIPQKTPGPFVDDDVLGLERPLRPTIFSSSLSILLKYYSYVRSWSRSRTHASRNRVYISRLSCPAAQGYILVKQAARDAFADTTAYITTAFTLPVAMITDSLASRMVFTPTVRSTVVTECISLPKKRDSAIILLCVGASTLVRLERLEPGSLKAICAIGAHSSEEQINFLDPRSWFRTSRSQPLGPVPCRQGCWVFPRCMSMWEKK